MKRSLGWVVVSCLCVLGCGVEPAEFEDVEISTGEGKEDGPSSARDHGLLTADGGRTGEWIAESSGFHAYRFKASAGQTVSLKLVSNDARVFLRLISHDLDQVDASGSALEEITDHQGFVTTRPSTARASSSSPARAPSRSSRRRAPT